MTGCRYGPLRNPCDLPSLRRDSTTLVVAESRNGAGWVWTEIRVSVPVPPEFAGAFTIYAIDENGNFYDWDEDGWPD